MLVTEHTYQPVAVLGLLCFFFNALDMYHTIAAVVLFRVVAVCSI